MARGPLDMAQVAHSVESAKRRANQATRMGMIDFLEREIPATEAESATHANLGRLRVWLDELRAVDSSVDLSRSPWE